jgi:hypothetical protein
MDSFLRIELTDMLVGPASVRTCGGSGHGTLTPLTGHSQNVEN